MVVVSLLASVCLLLLEVGGGSGNQVEWVANGGSNSHRDTRKPGPRHLHICVNLWLPHFRFLQSAPVHAIAIDCLSVCLSVCIWCGCVCVCGCKRLCDCLCVCVGATAPAPGCLSCDRHYCVTPLGWAALFLPPRLSFSALRFSHLFFQIQCCLQLTFECTWKIGGNAIVFDGKYLIKLCKFFALKRGTTFFKRFICRSVLKYWLSAVILANDTFGIEWNHNYFYSIVYFF